MFDINPYKTRMSQAVNRFQETIKKVRTGRAHPSMLEGIMVEAYGSKLPLNQVANILAPEPQLLQVTPFDPSTLQKIASAIREEQNLGLNPSDDGRVVRVPIPPLTTERRTELVKQLNEKVEEARIALRNVRHEALKDLKKSKEDKLITEDDVKRGEKSIDQEMNTCQAELEQIAKSKETEIMTI